MASAVDYNLIVKNLDVELDKSINIIVFSVVDAAKQFWFSYWLYIILFLVALIICMILQILMLRGDRHSKLPGWFNSLVGSLTYSFFFILMVSVSYSIWGPSVIDDSWFVLFGTSAYPMTKLFLIKIGFWYY